MIHLMLLDGTTACGLGVRDYENGRSDLDGVDCAECRTRVVASGSPLALSGPVFRALPYRPAAEDDTLTLRDQFAMAALTGLIANEMLRNACIAQDGEAGLARACYQMADQMLAARGQR